MNSLCLFTTIPFPSLFHSPHRFPFWPAHWLILYFLLDIVTHIKSQFNDPPKSNSLSFETFVELFFLFLLLIIGFWPEIYLSETTRPPLFLVCLGYPRCDIVLTFLPAQFCSISFLCIPINPLDFFFWYSFSRPQILFFLTLECIKIKQEWKQRKSPKKKKERTFHQRVIL